jgi:hypothetical protein
MLRRRQQRPALQRMENLILQYPVRTSRSDLEAINTKKSDIFHPPMCSGDYEISDAGSVDDPRCAKPSSPVNPNPQLRKQGALAFRRESARR